LIRIIINVALRGFSMKTPLCKMVNSRMFNTAFYFYSYSFIPITIFTSMDQYNAGLI